LYHKHQKHERKEFAMNIKDYCTNVDMELMLWKAKLDDVMSKVEKFSTGKKEGMFQEINGIHIILMELEDRLQQLRTECPLVWRPEQESIQQRLSDLSEKYQDATVEFFDYDFGG
jgi:hypothetical protein